MSTAPGKGVVASPEATFGELFEAVQLGRLLPDSKTFVDAIPSADPAVILARYRHDSARPGFDLRTFVDANFSLPQDTTPGTDTAADEPVREHIDRLWDTLTRNDEQAEPGSTRLALPYPYVVPGGRFREIYYWDSYFTMLGLAASGRTRLLEHMVANFAYLVDTVGFIPNGNRNYFCTRSQPPFFALMVELLAELSDDPSVYARFLPQLLKEHAFWMRDDEPHSRAISIDGETFNRYWDNATTPRPESFAEDVTLAAGIGDAEERGRLYRDIRAACESGWDFSSRWLAEPGDLASCRTTRLVPVELNCLLHELERVIARAAALAGDTDSADRYEALASARAERVRRHFFDTDRGWFRDLELPSLSRGGVDSLAALFPLFCRIASEDQAAAVAERLQRDFLRAGGWQTTGIVSGQQWDAPSGWAPLQWICYRGLRNYGFDDMAEAGATRWVDNNLAQYRATGRLLERYDVVNVGTIPPGGEYRVQDGFGWTNGVLRCLLDELGRQ